MPKHNIYVIKFGGSICRNSNLHRWIAALSQWSRDKRVVIVPGGGEFADNVRRLEGSMELGDKAAHELALDAMRRVGQKMMSAGFAELRFLCLPKLKEISSGYSTGCSLWVPTWQEYRHSGMPETWSVTSDSISLWLACELEVAELILLKSRLPFKQNPQKWTSEGYVDEYFPVLLKRNFPCRIRALANPASLL